MTDADGADWPPLPEADGTIDYDNVRIRRRRNVSAQQIADRIIQLQKAAVSTQLMVEQELAAMQLQLERYNRWPEDEFDDETMFLLKVAFDGSGRVYHYALLKAAGRWFVTGQRGNTSYVSWDYLRERFAQYTVQMWWVSGLEQVI